jgi:hypothetical protein
MGARRPCAEIHHRGFVAMVMVLMVVMVLAMAMTMIMAMMMLVVTIMMMSIMGPMAMHGPLSVVIPALLCSAFNGRLARSASANRTHQSTSSSLILSSSPEVTCN